MYLHAPASAAQQETDTTNGDLVVDSDLVADVPDIGQMLLDAGWTSAVMPHVRPRRSPFSRHGNCDVDRPTVGG